MVRHPTRSPYWFLLFGFLFLLQAAPRIWTDSITNDEAWETTFGYCYWKFGDVRTIIPHPPFAFALQSLPLLFMPLDGNVAPPIPGNRSIEETYAFVENRAYQFFYVLNPDKIDAMIAGPRWVTLIFGLGIGFLVFLMLRRQALFLLLAALSLWAFEPALLASAPLAKTDVPAAFFFFASVLVFRWCRAKGGWPQFLAGLVMGAAVCSKLSSLSLLPALLAMDVLEAGGSGNFRRNFPALSKRWGFILLGLSAFIYLAFLPGTLRLPEHGSPFGYFILKLREIAWYAGHPCANFFLGEGTFQRHLSYFPVAFVLKSTIPFLFLLAVGVGAGMKGRIHWESWQWLPPLFLLASLLKAPNLGIRYFLPAYPFLILMAAGGADWLWRVQKDKGWSPLRILVLGLLFWHAFSVAVQWPRHISYFNDAVSAGQKKHLLGDYNLDVGQDHKRLVERARERGWKNVKLAYVGMTDPYYYGLRWVPWTQRDLRGPQPGFTYVIDVGFLQEAPLAYPQTMPIVQSWIRNAPPTGQVGDTWLYYEFEGPLPRKDPSSPINSVPYFNYPNLPYLKAAPRGGALSPRS